MWTLPSGPSREIQTLVDLVRWRAFTQPLQLAYTFLPDADGDELQITYEELDQRVRGIAARLQSLNSYGERALLLYPPGLDYIAAFFGCLYAGVIAVPVYPPRLNRNLPRLQAIKANSEAVLALTTKPVLNHVQRLFSDAPDLQSLNWLTTDDIPAGEACDWREPSVSDRTTAFLQYTSGSTGTPKGVILTHENLLHNSSLMYECFEHSPGTRIIFWPPPYHDMGLIGGVLHPVYGGVHAALMSPVAFLQRPYRWLRAISRMRATTSGGPNFAYDLCVQRITSEQLETLDLSSWSVAINGAEPVRAETLESFAQRFAPCGFRREAFYPCYGLAEATLIVSGGAKASPPVYFRAEAEALERNLVIEAGPESENARTLVGCGCSLGGQQIIIVEPDSLTACPPEKLGEIWVSGPSVAGGYWNRPLETSQTFQAYLADTGRGPFLRTGDLGFFRDGQLFIAGRIKDLIIIGGLNYYPQDIEHTVEQSHPALRRGSNAAFTIELDGEEKLIVVQEVERQFRNPDVKELEKAIRQAVSHEHQLQVHTIALIKHGSIPKTSSNKIQRGACRTAFLLAQLAVLSQ